MTITVAVGRHNRPGGAARPEMPERYGAVSGSPTGLSGCAGQGTIVGNSSSEKLTTQFRGCCPSGHCTLGASTRIGETHGKAAGRTAATHAPQVAGAEGTTASTPARNPQAGSLGGQGGGRPAAWTLRKSRGQVSGCRGRPRTLHLGLPQVGSVGRQGLACSQACVLIPAAELLCLRFLDTRLLVGPPNNNAFLQRLFLWLL